MPKIKIVHLATTSTGGAAIAAIRLHKSLLQNGYDSKFLFLEGKESDSFYSYKTNIFFRNILIRLLKKINIPLSADDFKIRNYRKQFELFSFASTEFNRLHLHPLIQNADIIHLHWIANFIDFDSFFTEVNKPIVWTLHDMNPFQGAFHYKNDEVNCPQKLKSLDRLQHEIKKLGLSQLRGDILRVAAPSKWLVNLSAKSEILRRFQHIHIPYGLDVTVFKPMNKEMCKLKLNFPTDKVVVLFVAELVLNYRKGFDLLVDLVKDRSVSTLCHFVAVGKVEKSKQIPGIHYLGKLTTEKKLSETYNAADIFIIPSREDNLPNTMIESLCCGTPVVGFAIGGIKETIRNYENGISAETISLSHLKNALSACIKNIKAFDRSLISEQAHLRYNSQVQFKKYLNLYSDFIHPEIAAENSGSQHVAQPGDPLIPTISE